MMAEVVVMISSFSNRRRKDIVTKTPTQNVSLQVSHKTQFLFYLAFVGQKGVLSSLKNVFKLKRQKCCQ